MFFSHIYCTRSSPPPSSLFVQVVVYGMALSQALNLFNATVSKQALHQRIARWRNNLKPPFDATMQEIEALRRGAVPETASSLAGEEIVVTPATLSATQLSSTTAFGLDRAPSWMDRDKMILSMTLRKKRTPSQVCRDNFDSNSKAAYYSSRISTAFKQATTELKSNMDNPTLRGKRGYGVISIAKKYNSTLLSSPNDRRIKESMLHEAVAADRIGKSPPKCGWPSIIPDCLHDALATHSTMMQVAGEGEASSGKMISLTAGLVAGTAWENKFNLDYCWRRTRAKNPAILNPVKAKNNEDRRVEWLTYKNIMDWTERAKQFLLDIKMAKDEPGIIRE